MHSCCSSLSVVGEQVEQGLLKPIESITGGFWRLQCFKKITLGHLRAVKGQMNSILSSPSKYDSQESAPDVSFTRLFDFELQRRARL